MTELVDQGAAQILAKAREYATSEGISLATAVWNAGKDLSGLVDQHSLVISSGARKSTGVFQTEWIEDYPGGVGVGPTDALIRKMVREIKAR